MVDTNSDPRPVDFPIPANDDASRSVATIMDVMIQAIAEGLHERKLDKAASPDDADDAGADEEGVEAAAPVAAAAPAEAVEAEEAVAEEESTEEEATEEEAAEEAAEETEEGSED